MEIELSNLEVLEISDALNKVSSLPVNPLKFCSIRNIGAISESVLEINKRELQIFHSNVLLDDEGNPKVKENLLDVFEILKSEGKDITLSFYDYGDSEEVFNKQISDLYNERRTIHIHQESLSRNIFLTLTNGEKTTATIENLLEDPYNGIDVDMIAKLMKHILKE